MDTTNWKWFRYDEIFDIKHGFYNKKPEDNPHGNIPFIGATDSNNGITSYSDMDTISVTTKTGEGKNAPIEEKIFSNCIAVTNNGSVGYAYYQEQPFTCTHDVNPLYLKDKELNKYIAIFLCTIIEKDRFRWAYGRKWRPARMPSSRMKLPVTAKGTPDWQYVEDYVKNTLIPQLPEQARAVWEGKYNVLPQAKMKKILEMEKWKDFRIGDYFDSPYKATAYNAINMQEVCHNDESAIAYVTRTDVNNGIKCFLKKEDNMHYEHANAITLGDTTSTVFYQGQDFVCGDHMVVFRSKYLNKYTGMFIVTLLNRERYRYSYGRAYLKEALADTILRLPATANPDGTYSPDWQFMEDYIKSLPYSRNI